MVKKINEFKELQKKKGKKGFSMIELIIVLAIMAILVALIGTQLIPYLQKSREKRDMTTLDTCMTALQSAVSDHEITLSSGTTYHIGTAPLDGTVATDFTKYSGLATGDTPFKSDAAGTGNTVALIDFTVDANGKLTAKVGNITVESSKGGSVTSN